MKNLCKVYSLFRNHQAEIRIRAWGALGFEFIKIGSNITQGALIYV